MDCFKRIKVAVIAGGRSREREVSLKSGLAVYNSLNREKYDPILCDTNKDLSILFEKRDEIDIAFPLLHGKFGEDGCIQGFLNTLNIPFVGSDVLASAIAMNKKISKQILKANGLHVPEAIAINKSKDFHLQDIATALGFPIVVKPVSEGSSFGINICDNKNELINGIDNAFKYDDELIIEEYIEGREVTAPIIGYKELEILPLVEIVPKEGHAFFDFEAKYTPDATDEICPANISPFLEKDIKRCAEIAFRALGCNIWSRVDMIVRRDKVYVLEVNTIPGMTENSLFPLSARKMGIEFPELLDKLISLSIFSYKGKQA